MKKRITVVAVVAAAAAVALALPSVGAPARPGDQKGPACSDIFVQASLVNVGATVGEPATVQWTLTTPLAASCLGGVYTVTVYDASGTTILGGARYDGNGEDAAFVGSFQLASAPEAVCVSATSSLRGRITDSAPDEGCQLVELSESGGASGFG
ncbi:MAG: hypothetical protein ACRDNP_04860 [Gaiellaceae bacterium]